MAKLKIFTVESVHNSRLELGFGSTSVQEIGMNKKALKNVVTTLALVTLFFVVLVSLPTQKVMATTTISINPSTGEVGSTIGVNGTIDTPDGFFTVRWNQTLNITTGQAAGFDVITSFIVPQTLGAPTGRNISIELIDDFTGSIAAVNFTLFTKFHIVLEVPSLPGQLQQSSTIPMAVNVTGGEADTVYTANITVRDPANQNYSTVFSLSNTTTTGYGEANRTYPTDFGAEAHTNYTGAYRATFNETLAERTFSVGLSNATEYIRFQVINIRAANYTQPNEHAWVNITFAGATVFSQNVSAVDGIVEAFWKIPADASIGAYTLSIANATTPGTRKPVSDVQEFNISRVFLSLEVQTQNLSGEALSGVAVDAYNKTAKVTSESTNQTGWASFSLEIGNYTLKAILTPKNVEIGAISNLSLTRNMTLILTCQLTNIKVLVEDEAHAPMPFVNLVVRYNYTTINNETLPDTKTFATNNAGTGELRNMFAKISYVIEAKRYGFLFNTTRIQSLPAQPWINLTITVPTLGALVNVVDSKDAAIEDILLAVYEWSSGTTQPVQSQRSVGGSVTFFLTFGKYRLRALDGSLVLNETVLDLIEDNLNFTFHLTIVNTDFTVWVRDYFGQPIANANVTVERKIGEGYVFAYSQFTGADGSTTFASKVGGESRISVYVGGKLVAVKTQFLSGRQSLVKFQVAEHVAILGYPISTSLFALLIFLIVIAGAALVLARGRLMKGFEKKSKR